MFSVLLMLVTNGRSGGAVPLWQGAGLVFSHLSIEKGLSAVHLKYCVGGVNVIQSIRVWWFGVCVCVLVIVRNSVLVGSVGGSTVARNEGVLFRLLGRLGLCFGVVLESARVLDGSGMAVFQ